MRNNRKEIPCVFCRSLALGLLCAHPLQLLHVWGYVAVKMGWVCLCWSCPRAAAPWNPELLLQILTSWAALVCLKWNLLLLHGLWFCSVPGFYRSKSQLSVLKTQCFISVGFLARIVAFWIENGVWVSPVIKPDNAPWLFSLFELPWSGSGEKCREDVPGMQWSGTVNTKKCSKSYRNKSTFAPNKRWHWKCFSQRNVNMKSYFFFPCYWNFLHPVCRMVGVMMEVSAV